MSKSEGSAFIFQFVAGKWAGSEFSVSFGRTYLIGRNAQCDLVLREDMVSRRHAGLRSHEGKILIEDLGSSNGVVVNGQRIKQAILKVGDRLVIGSSMIQVVAASAKGARGGDSFAIPPPLPAEVRAPTPVPSTHRATVEWGHGKGFPPRTPSPEVSMTVETEIPIELVVGTMPGDREVSDVLHWLRARSLTGLLVVDGSHRVRGTMFIRDGECYATRLGDAPNPTCDSEFEVQFKEIVAWGEGTYRFVGSKAPPYSVVKYGGDTEALLARAISERDGLRALLPLLPPHGSTLELCRPLEAKFAELSAEVLETLRFVHNLGDADAVMAASPASKVETCRDILFLISAGYIQVAG